MVDFTPTSLSITESPTSEIRLYAGTSTRFKVIDLQTVTVEEIVVPGVSEEMLGGPVKGVLCEGLFVLCYERKCSSASYPVCTMRINAYHLAYIDMGIMTKLHLNVKENRTLTWRNPLTFTGMSRLSFK